MKSLIYLLGFTLVACSSVTTNNDEVLIDDNIDDDTLIEEAINEQPIEENNFNAFYKKFTSTIITKNTVTFNTFIHKDYGLHFIEAPGAMPMFTKIYAIEKFKDVNTNKAFFELSFTEINKIPVNDSLPKIICGGAIFNKYGCFAQHINPLNESQIWNYADLNDKQKQEIEVIAQTITYTVVNTANYTFYFSLIANNWYVTFIDIRTPCSA